jgi:phage terminase large subunit GpA-like protein
MENLYRKHIADIEKKIFLNAAESFIPPDNIEIDEWAEGKLELSARVTRHPGLVRFDLTPYLRTPLRAIKHSPRVVCLFGAQVGKTLMQQCALGYTIDQDPKSTMVVFPSQSFCRRRSTKHLQPLLKESEVLSKHIPEGTDLNLFEYALDRMDVSLAWAGSETMISSEPIAYLMRDEISKFDQGALSNSEARTTSYDWMARIFDTSTPKTKNDPGYQEYINGTCESFEVPCPHCQAMQKLVFKNFVYPGKKEDEKFAEYLNRVQDETYVKCVECGKEIKDIHKPLMLIAGQWKAENPKAKYRSFTLASWYAPWVSFGKAALAFVKAKDDPVELMNWVNNFAAEFWEQKGEQADKNKILAHKLGYEPGTIPTTEPVMLITTVDVQAAYVWYLIRAHSLSKSWLLEYGTAAVLQDIGDIRRKSFLDLNNQAYSPMLSFIDSGYRTLEVYQYALTEPYLFATKGQDGSQTTPIRWQKINKYPGSEKDLPGVVNLMHIDTIFFKEQLLLHIQRGISPEGHFDETLSDWYLHNKTSDGYAHQIMAEGPIELKDKKGNIKREWHRFHKANHLLDLEVAQLAARYLYKEKLKELAGIKKQKPTVYEQKAPEDWK